MKKVLNETKQIVAQLKWLLNGGYAHVTFENATAKLPAKYCGVVPDGMPYSIWQLVEHIHIAQWDILEFSRDPKHKSPEWPKGYWVKETKPADNKTWSNALKQIKSDRKEFTALLEKKDADIYAPFAWGDGQNLLREALLIADHNAYHVGEIIAIRRLLGVWG